MSSYLSPGVITLTMVAATFVLAGALALVRAYLEMVDAALRRPIVEGIQAQRQCLQRPVREMRSITPVCCPECGSRSIRQLIMAILGPSQWFCDDCAGWFQPVAAVGWEQSRPADAWAPAVAAISENSMRLLGEME